MYINIYLFSILVFFALFGAVSMCIGFWTMYTDRQEIDKYYGS